MQDAIAELRRRAQSGEPVAQSELGYAYATGNGVKIDFGEAVVAAEAGHASAQFNLGNHYRDGTGVPRNQAYALLLFRLAANAGNINAQYNLAHMLFHGQGAMADPGQAFYWWRTAAEAGDACIAERSTEKLDREDP